MKQAASCIPGSNSFQRNVSSWVREWSFPFWSGVGQLGARRPCLSAGCTLCCDNG